MYVLATSSALASLPAYTPQELLQCGASACTSSYSRILPADVVALPCHITLLVSTRECTRVTEQCTILSSATVSLTVVHSLHRRLQHCSWVDATITQQRLQIFPGALGNDAQGMMHTTADNLLITAAGTELVIKRHCTAAESN